MGERSADDERATILKSSKLPKSMEQQDLSGDRIGKSLDGDDGTQKLPVLFFSIRLSFENLKI